MGIDCGVDFRVKYMWNGNDELCWDLEEVKFFCIEWNYWVCEEWVMFGWKGIFDCYGDCLCDDDFKCNDFKVCLEEV